MLRFDYLENDDGSFTVNVVSEIENSHSLCGRLILNAKEWKELWTACVAPDPYDTKEKFFKFENKGSQI